MQRINKIETLAESRRELARLIKAYYRQELDSTTFRNLVYSFSVLLNYHKTETEQEIEKRLTELEQKVGI